MLAVRAAQEAVHVLSGKKILNASSQQRSQSILQLGRKLWQAIDKLLPRPMKIAKHMLENSIRINVNKVRLLLSSRERTRQTKRASINRHNNEL